MNASEYTNLEAVEGEHWYYAGKRVIVRWWLSHCGPPRAEQILLDCGAGTGCFAQEMSASCRVLVLDNHEEALRMLRVRFHADQIIGLVDGGIPLPDSSLDYVTALDVLEHVADDAGVVRGFTRLVKPGGLVVVTVPAGMALWSDWDVALQHFRRYSKRQLQALFEGQAWEIVHVNYTNLAAFLPAWFVRKGRSLLARCHLVQQVRMEDRVPPRGINGLLKKLFVITGTTRVPLPFGVSLVLVARRR